MLTVFYIAGFVAVIATVLAITQRHAVHALLFLIVSLLAVAVEFYLMGAPFVAALEVMIYAGAILVLFVFVVMMLNVADHAMEVERAWLHPRNWLGPSILSLVLLGALIYSVKASPPMSTVERVVTAKEVGVALFGTYWFGVELASLLLMAGLVGAYHLGRHEARREEEISVTNTRRARLGAGDDVVRAGSGRTTHSA